MVVADPLQESDAIVVFGGQLPFRAMEAAAIYRQGWAPELGVAASAIHILQPQCVNTTDEVKVALDTLKARGGTRLILVSSESHTGRIRVAWHALADSDRKATVRYTNQDPYDPARWWANSRDALSVTREVDGILNAWAGFPLNAARQ